MLTESIQNLSGQHWITKNTLDTAPWNPEVANRRRDQSLGAVQDWGFSSEMGGNFDAFNIYFFYYLILSLHIFGYEYLIVF